MTPLEPKPHFNIPLPLYAQVTLLSPSREDPGEKQ